MSARLADRHTGVIADINVTPLADVMIVLLIIFMVATPILTRAPVALPRAVHAHEQLSRLDVLVTAADAISVQGVRVPSVTGLEQLLRDRLVIGPSELSVTVQADRAAPYGDVARVLDACRAAGVQEVGLAARTELR